MGNEIGFNLYVSRNGAPFQVLTSEPRGATTTETIFLTKGIVYVVRATAYNLAGESGPSSTISIDFR